MSENQKFNDEDDDPTETVDFNERKLEITEMINGINRLNYECISSLERYLKLQCRVDEYDADANFTLLKLYQQYPDQANPSYMDVILCKAIMNLPASDFLQCRYLITPDFMSHMVENYPDYDMKVGVLIDICQRLETCQFQDFWNHFQGGSELQWREVIKSLSIVDMGHFEEAVRRYIAHVVTSTFQRISRDQLITYLGIDSDAVLDRYIIINKYLLISNWIGFPARIKLEILFRWTPEDNGLVFTYNHEDKVKPKHIKERTSFKTVAQLINPAAVESA